MAGDAALRPGDFRLENAFGLDGPALYNEILARWPTGGPRVLFTSGFAEISQYEAPATRDVPLLFKPFTIDDLRDAVGRVLIGLPLDRRGENG